MSPSRTFILRPVATTLLMVGILLAGAVAYKQLPVSALPEVDYPTIQVTTFYPGASPDVMASSVTAPLERQFGQVPGLQQMTSTSSDGSSVITLEFNLSSEHRRGRAGGAAVDQCLGNLSACRSSHAAALQQDQSGRYADSDAGADLERTCRCPRWKIWPTRGLAPKISQLPGVGLVSISGGQKPAVRIQANPTSAGVLRHQHGGSAQRDHRRQRESGQGQFRRTRTSLIRSARTISLLSSADYATAGRGLSQWRAGEDDGRRRRDGRASRMSAQAAWMNQTPAVILNIQRQPGANIIVGGGSHQHAASATHIDAARSRSGLDSDRPDQHHSRLGSRRAVRTDADHRLVVMVIFSFLRNISATIIPSVAVPLSLVGTFGVMYMLGYSLNNLTLMALTISTGFVVDDAIVMIENIVRYIEEGEHPLQAALQGLGADRFHHHLADHFADRGADSAAVHGRHRRPVVPRVRRHAGGDDPGLGGRVADADADDVLEAAEAQAGIEPDALLCGVGKGLGLRSSASTTGP